MDVTQASTEQIAAASINELIDWFGREFLEPAVRDLWHEAKAAGIPLERFGQMRAAEIHSIFLARRTLAGVPSSNPMVLERLQILLATRGGRPVTATILDGGALKDFRQSRDLDQPGFAEICNLSVDTIKRAESGRSVSAASASKIAEGLSELAGRKFTMEHLRK